MNYVDDIDADDDEIEYGDDENEILRFVGFGGAGGWVVTADSGQQTPTKLTNS